MLATMECSRDGRGRLRGGMEQRVIAHAGQNLGQVKRAFIAVPP
jgi:hypothetical protein